MAKYDPSFEYLAYAEDCAVEMTFADIEHVGGPLPASASKHPAWWANEAEGGRHGQTHACKAERQVEWIDPARRRVRFSAARRPGAS